jgi:hypothetical protein
MTSHVGVMVVFAACVSIVFATWLRDEPREQLRTAARIFGGFVVGAYILGWVMFGIYG